MRVEDVPVGRFRGLDGSRRVWSEAYHESLNLSAFDRRGRPGAAPIGCMTCLGHGRRLIDRPRRSTDVRSSSHNRCGSSAPPSLSPSFFLRRPRPPPPPSRRRGGMPTAVFRRRTLIRRKFTTLSYSPLASWSGHVTRMDERRLSSRAMHCH